MIHPLELFIGLRYTRAKRRNRFISFISVMATLGIVLGVTAMITVLSVMNGFGDELRSRILGVVSHVTIEKKHGLFKDWQPVIQKVESNKSITGIAPYVAGQGMLTGERGSRPVIVRGVDPKMEKTVSNLDRHMISGSMDNLVPGSYGIVIGRELAWRLGVVPGSRVTLVANETLVTPAGLLPRFKQFTVVGIFEIGQGEYDNGFAMVNIQDAAKIYRKGKGVSGIRIQLDDLFKAIPVAHEIATQLGSSYKVEDWSQQHRTFFRALRIEKSAMFITMTLIIAVAAFNIIAMLTMLISDKRTDIAILRTLGMSPNRAMTIFMYHGLLLGFTGTLLGVIGGVSLASNISAVIHFFESITGVQLMTADVYYVSNIVAKLEWSDVAAIAASAFVLTLLAAIYPARRAAMIQPAQALRYE
jgi:lipoprotein-releasing system permease protein